MASGGDDLGFTLIEVLVATALAAVAVVSISSLFLVSIRLVTEARDRTIETALAVQKIEQVASSRLASLDISPPDSLDADVPGFFDRVDSRGAPVPAGMGAARVYLRRWSIRAAAEGGNLPLVVQVRVGTPVELARSNTASAGVLLTAARPQEVD